MQRHLSTIAGAICTASVVAVLFFVLKTETRPTQHGGIDIRHPVATFPDDQVPLIEIFGSTATRTSDGEYVDVDESFYLRSRLVPSEPQELDQRVANHPVFVGVISAKSTSAVIRVSYLDEIKDIEIRTDPWTDVYFAADSVKVSIVLGRTTVAPLSPDDPVLNVPVAAYRLDPARDSTRTISRSRDSILETKEMTAQQAKRVQAFLIGNGYLSIHYFDCFEPGMAFQFGHGLDAIHVIVCLGCQRMRIIRADSDKMGLDYGLNDAGVKELKAMYDEIF